MRRWLSRGLARVIWYAVRARHGEQQAADFLDAWGDPEKARRYIDRYGA